MPVRSYVAGHFMLVLDGKPCGFLKSVDGGAVTAEVVAQPVGPSYLPKKQLGRVIYEPYITQFGMSTAGALHDWISALLTGQPIRKNGAIIMADVNLTALSQREFSNALITEVSFPALDGGSKEAAYLTLKFAPEYTRTTKASGKIAGAAKTDQKWLPSNFRLTIDGLDCARVSSIGAMTIRQSFDTGLIGGERTSLVPGRVEYPNLTVTLAETAAQSWLAWFEDFVIKGNNAESYEKTGSLSLLAANQVDELMRIDLFNLGIFRIGSDKAEANSEQIATMTAHLYCERMEMHVGEVKPAAMRRQARKKAKRSTSRRRRSRR